MLITTSSQFKIIVLNRNNFLSFFVVVVVVEVYHGWNFVCWINIGMIMDNSFFIPWLSSLDFQVTINNKARFMIFFINIFPSFYHFLGLFVICFSLKFSPSSLQKINSQLYIFLIIIHVVFYYIFPGSFLKVSKHSIKVFLKKISWSLYLHILFL